MNPCPIDATIVSPIYHGWCKVCFFQNLLGFIPFDSLGWSIPVYLPIPNLSNVLWILFIPTFKLPL